MGIEVLLVLFILWVVVTLIGHGTWVLLAAMFGQRKPPPRAPREPEVRADPQSALDALGQQLARLADLKSVDAQTYAAIQAAIKAQEERLADVAAKKATAAAAPLPTVTPIATVPKEALAEPAAPAVLAAPEPATSPAERVRAYAASRIAAVESEPVPPPAPPKPREALSRLFAAFMEEKNIRWGELVGGLLIVGCSVALVISFWSEIAARPMLKFGLLGGVTAALFGVGLYTDRRWKIHTTSHGILVIATLLVPLNFLAIAAFTRGAAANDAVTLVGEVVSAMVFAALVYLAGRIISPGAAVPLAVGVMVPSLAQLLVRRWAEPTATLALLYALAAVPIACYVATTSVVVRRRAIDPVFEESNAIRLFTLLGVVSAATFFPLALLAWKVPPVEDTIHRLSPLVVWCGVPALLCGLLFWRRMTERKLSGIQTAGLAVGVLGAGIMAGAAVAAWPDPATLLPVAAMNFFALTAVAFWFGIPAAHLPAGLALVAMWLISIYVRRGDVGWTLASYEPLSRVLVSAMTGRMLVPLVAVFGVAAGMLRRSGRREDGLMYAIVAAVTAAASLALVLWFGFARAGDPENIVWTLGIYAIAALVAGVLLDRPAVVWVGPVLLLAALWQAIVYRWANATGLELPRVTVLIIHATLMVLGASAIAWRCRGHANLRTALVAWAAISSAVAAGLLVAAIPETSTGTVAVYLAWLAAVWLALSFVTSWAGVFTASQIAAVLAIFAGVTAAVETRDWYTAAAHPWLDPWFLAAEGVALAFFALVMGGVRWIFSRIAARRAEFVIELPPPAWYAVGDRLLNAPWPAVDRVLQVVLVVVFVAVAIYAAVPGVGQELAPLEAARGAAAAVRVVTPIDDFEIAGIDHTHAADRGAWLFGAAVVATIVVGMQQRRHLEWWALALLLVIAMVCPLAAARWEPEVAVASALRWCSAGFFLVASAALWAAARGRNSIFDGIRFKLLRNLLVALVVLVYVAMGAYVASSALRIAGVAPSIEAWMPWVLGWAFVAGLAGLALPHVWMRQFTALPEVVVEKLQPQSGAMRNALLLLAFCPLAIVCAFAVAAALDQHPIVGPDPASWFRSIGWDVTYGVPLAIVALTLVGHAIRDRSSGLAFSAGLLANVVATIVVLMRLARGGNGLDATAWVTIAQVNAIVAGVAAIAWLAAVRWSRAREPVLLRTQTALATAFCGTFLLPGAVQLAAEPASSELWLDHAGGVTGWIALALATIAACWSNWRRTVYQPIVAFFLAALVALVALASLRWDTGNWLAYHTLLVGLTAAAWLLPIVTLAANRLLASADDLPDPIIWSSVSARVFGLAAVALGIRALDGDPAAPWWTIGVLTAICLRNVWIAWRTGGRGSMWIAAALANLAVSIWWIDQGHRLTATSGRGEPVEFLWINAIAAAVAAVISAWVERRTLEWAVKSRWISVHRFVAWAIVVVLLITTAGRLVGDLSGNFIEVSTALGWAAWCAAVVAAVACWWDPRSRWPVACIYTVGLVAVGMYLDGLDFQPPMFEWALAMALAAYSLATSFLWSRRSEIGAVLARLRVPAASQGESGHGWLVAVNGLSAVAVLALVAWIEVSMPELRHRMIAAYAVGAEALAIALLARGAVRSPLQYVALVFGVLFAVAFGWAWLSPDMPAPWLHRVVAAIVALAVMMVVYGLGLVKLLRREND
ncbi:MAG: hypothetical protein WD845_04705, partial [Pirellulales bacterium]